MIKTAIVLLAIVAGINVASGFVGGGKAIDSVTASVSNRAAQIEAALN